MVAVAFYHSLIVTTKRKICYTISSSFSEFLSHFPDRFMPMKFTHNGSAKVPVSLSIAALVFTVFRDI